MVIKTTLVMCLIAGMHKAKIFQKKSNPKITKEIKTKIKNI